jgi:hypothetical protein
MPKERDAACIMLVKDCARPLGSRDGADLGSVEEALWGTTLV